MDPGSLNKADYSSCRTKMKHLNYIPPSENHKTFAVYRALNFVISKFMSTNNPEQN